MKEKRAQIIYSGTVHGVGFRWTVQEIAESMAVTGWVRNCPDGTVEVVCEGSKDEIGILMNKIKKAMGNYIKSSEVEWQKATGEFDTFNIAFTH